MALIVLGEENGGLPDPMCDYELPWEFPEQPCGWENPYEWIEDDYYQEDED
jgi:hypothetical protein